MGSRICLLLLLLMGSSSVGDSIDDVLDGTLVGDIPLGELLASWDAVDCGGDRRALEAALGSAGRVHRALVEDWGFALVANAWDRRARAFTPAGADLLRTWLDGPDLARRRFFCEDGLPDTLRALAAADYPAAAAAHLASEARARAEVLATVPSPAAEVALLALLTLDGDLRARFDAQYPDHAEAAARVALGAALDAVDLEHIEPWDMGFSPRPGDPIEPVFPRIRYPKLGWGDIPDPADVAAAMRVAEAWARRRTAIVSDLRVARRRLADLATELARAPEGADLDRLGRSILRAEAGVSHALAELARHRAAVPHATTYRPVADSIVHHSLRPAEEDAIDLALAATRTAREEAVALAESAISKGADIPRRWAVAGARAAEGGPGSPWTAGRVGAGPGPGRRRAPPPPPPRPGAAPSPTATTASGPTPGRCPRRPCCGRRRSWRRSPPATRTSTRSTRASCWSSWASRTPSSGRGPGSRRPCSGRWRVPAAWTSGGAKRASRS